MDKLGSSPVDDDRGADDTLPQSPRRVKVYLLLGDDWIDNGTGYCVGEVDDDRKLAYFLVRDENDEKAIILKSYLNGSIHYQRQQETLIVWTDLLGKDLALSFQETEGCADLCEFIIKVQRQSISPGILLHYVLQAIGSGEEVTELITGPITFPPAPTATNIAEINEALAAGSKHHYTCQEISRHWVEEGYWTAVAEVFRAVEAEENAPAIWELGEMVQKILGFNDPIIIDLLIDNPKATTAVLGIMEYNAETPTKRACYREAINPQFIQVVPVQNETRFWRDCVLRYMKNIVFVNHVSEATNSMLQSMLYDNQVEITRDIISLDFFERVFALFDDGNLVEKRRDAVRLVYQYITMAKQLQQLQRLEFYTHSITHGLFKAIRWAMADTDVSIRILGVELTTIIIEQDTKHIHAMADTARATGETTGLCHLLVKLLVSELSPGLQVQAYEAIKILIDPGCDEASEEFGDNLANFYRDLAPTLFAPLKTSLNAPLCQHLCELVALCIKDHSLVIQLRQFFKGGTLSAVVELLNRPVKLQVKLAALRCIKNLMRLCDDDITSYIIDTDMLAPFSAWFGPLVSHLGMTNLAGLSLIDSVASNLHEPLRNTWRIAKYLVAHLDVLEHTTSGQRLLQLFHESARKRKHDDPDSPGVKKIAL